MLSRCFITNHVNHSSRRLRGRTVILFSNAKSFVLPKFTANLSQCHERRECAQTRSGRPSVITLDLKGTVDGHFRENSLVTIDELHEVFPHISRPTPYATVTVKLRYGKICSRWAPRVITDGHKQKLKKQLRRLNGVATDFYDEGVIKLVQRLAKFRNSNWDFLHKHCILYLVVTLQLFG